MSDGYIFAIVCVVGLTLSSIFKSVFYYKYESKRQIELARAKKDKGKS